MKKSTSKTVLIAIIPIIVVIGLGIYIANRVPQIRFAIARYVTGWSLDRSVRKGKMSQEGANEIKEVVNRIFITSEKLEKLGVDKDKIDKEIEALATSQEFQQISDDNGLSDEEVEVLVDFLNKIAAKLEELAQEAESDSP
jgi:hypothetical protein